MRCLRVRAVFMCAVFVVCVRKFLLASSGGCTDDVTNGGALEHDEQRRGRDKGEDEAKAKSTTQKVFEACSNPSRDS